MQKLYYSVFTLKKEKGKHIVMNAFCDALTFRKNSFLESSI